MKLTRIHLLRIAAGLGIFLIVYGFFRHFSGIEVDEGLEKMMIDGVVLASLGLFVYSRKLAADEKKERERGENASADENKP
ncbi:MAG: hypothetical protein LBH70_07125 [Spirochaetaceae bacterium]|jgi:hypothetical protein|nr:hypothetical protein [Spirochaetaceae bacterium]